MLNLDFTNAESFYKYGKQWVYLEQIEYNLKKEKFKGLICEFGVADGLSLNFIAEKSSDRVVYGFDSFEGISEDWHNLKAGYFKTDYTKLFFRGNAKLYVGYFSETIPRFLNEISLPASFINIDCDLYYSTVDILEGMNDRIIPGTIIYFDELINYPGYEEGEYKALEEWVEKYKVKFRVLSYSDDRGVSIEILEKG